MSQRQNQGPVGRLPQEREAGVGTVERVSRTAGHAADTVLDTARHLPRDLPGRPPVGIERQCQSFPVAEVRARSLAGGSLVADLGPILCAPLAPAERGMARSADVAIADLAATGAGAATAAGGGSAKRSTGISPTTASTV